MCNEGNFGAEMSEVLQNMRHTCGALESLDWGSFVFPCVAVAIMSRVLNCLLNFDFFSVWNRVATEGRGSAASLVCAGFLKSESHKTLV